MIPLEFESYEIPNGGKSLPIIFNFDGIIPENDLIINCSAYNINTTEEGIIEYIESPYITFE